MIEFHVPVLLQSVCEYLAVSEGKRYIDTTLGTEGHTREIISRGGLVLGIDQDPDSLSACPNLDGLTKIRGNFMFLKDIALAAGYSKVDGVLFDLGMSSRQLDNPERGFSFQKTGPLDMRMDQSQSITAAMLINTLSEDELAEILHRYGEINSAKSYARKIIQARPLITTEDLSRIFIHSNHRRQAFQALRIAVNGEILALESGLQQAIDLLLPGGRLVVISYQSLEDRLVKVYFKKWESTGIGKVLTSKPILPNISEILSNPRAKSSKLRAFSKNI